MELTHEVVTLIVRIGVFLRHSVHKTNVEDVVVYSHHV